VWSIGSQRKNSKMHEAACLDLMDPYQVGRPPEKLHQGCLIHAKLRLAICILFLSRYDNNCVSFGFWLWHAMCVCAHAWWFQRSYVCVVDDCQASYRRKDHLNRHLLQHQGKTFKCPVENCSTEFSLQSNVKRHVEEIHDDSSTCDKTHKQHTCPEIGCGKVFRFVSQLRKHEDSHGRLSSFWFSVWVSEFPWIFVRHFIVKDVWHNFEESLYLAVKLESVDVLCLEPGCMKHFTNVQCLQAHVKSSHQYMTCETCGTKQLKNNIKRHMRTHEPLSSPKTLFQCEFKGCSCTFSRVRLLILKHVSCKFQMNSQSGYKLNFF